MLVEHSFITTVNQQDCFDRVHGLLIHLRYRLVETTESEVVYQKGPPKPKPNVGNSELPQAVAVKFDRGKVTVAASIMVLRDRSKAVHSQSLVTIANAIEQQVTTLDESQRVARVKPLIDEIIQINIKSGQLAKSAKKRGCLIAVGVVVLTIALITLIVSLTTGI